MAEHDKCGRTTISGTGHFNKKVPLRSALNTGENLHERLAQVEGQIAKKQGKMDQRSASLQALLKERAELQTRLETQEKGLQ
jgi:hypothetical protein